MEHVERKAFQNYSLEECNAAIKLLLARKKFLTDKVFKDFTEALFDHENDDLFLLKDVAELKLRNKTRKILQKKGFKTVGDILEYGIDKLTRMKSCGETTANEIVEALYGELMKVDNTPLGGIEISI